MAAGIAITSVPGFAFDPGKVAKGDDATQHILRYGYDALKAGNHSEALSAFRHNADQNHVPSQWKLARLFQTGRGVKSDQLAAYKLYTAIAERFAERAPNRADRPYVSSAVVELGKYALNGIEGTEVYADVELAEVHFNRAALLYGNANAQYFLGRLYLDQNRGLVNPVRAARWLKRASRKGHTLAQAELGDMLFHGRGVKKNRVLGLVYLTRASAKSKAKNLRNLRRNAFAAASDAQRRAAIKILNKLNIALDTEDSNTAPQGTSAFGLKANTQQNTSD